MQLRSGMHIIWHNFRQTITMKYLLTLTLAFMTVLSFGQELSDAAILKLIYGNSKSYGSQVTAEHEVTVNDFNSTCNQDKKLSFEITAKKSYTCKGVPVMLVFTAAPTINKMDCQVPVGVAYLKKTGGVWKVVDSRKYFMEVGNVGQGGFYDFVKITDNDYAAIAFTDKVLNGIESTNMTVVGIYNDKIMDFTSGGMVTISQRNKSASNMKPIFSSTYSFERGEDEIYVLIMNKNTSKSTETAAVSEQLLYQFVDGTFKPQ
jgi:hypothetical protein